MAAEEKHDEKKSTAAAAMTIKQDEKTNVAALEKWEEEMKMNVVRYREAPWQSISLSFQTDEGSQRQRVIETRPVRDLNTLKGEMGETTGGDQTDGWTEWEMRGDWGHLYGPEYCSVCGQNPFDFGCLNVSFESRREKNGGKKERERDMENGWDGSGGYFEGDAGRNGRVIASG